MLSNNELYVLINSGESDCIEKTETTTDKDTFRKYYTFDTLPSRETSLQELNTNIFKNNYLPLAISPDILEANHRDFEQQLASLSFYDLRYKCATFGGVLMFSPEPRRFLAGSYIQYVRFQGVDTMKPRFEKTFSGMLADIFKNIDDFVNTSIIVEEIVSVPNTMREKIVRNYSNSFTYHNFSIRNNHRTSRSAISSHL